MAERLINIELVLVEHRRVIDHFAGRMEHVYEILRDVDIEITEDDKDKLSMYLNDYVETKDATGSELSSVREFKKELEKYKKDITTYGES